MNTTNPASDECQEQPKPSGKTASGITAVVQLASRTLRHVDGRLDLGLDREREGKLDLRAEACHILTRSSDSK